MVNKARIYSSHMGPTCPMLLRHQLAFQGVSSRDSGAWFGNDSELPFCQLLHFKPDPASTGNSLNYGDFLPSTLNRQIHLSWSQQIHACRCIYSSSRQVTGNGLIVPDHVHCAQPYLITGYLQILSEDYITCFGRIGPVLLSGDLKISAVHVYILTFIQQSEETSQKKY